MPTYTTATYTPYHEHGIAITPGGTVETEVILTEVKASVATPEDYIIGETVQIGDPAVTGIVWGNQSDGLRLIHISGTLPTTVVVITGVTSAEVQTALPVRCCTRTADTPIHTPQLHSAVLTSSGVSDPQTLRIDRETETLLISEIVGGPITLVNATTGYTLCTAIGLLPFTLNHLCSEIIFNFTSAGTCRVQQFRESKFASNLRQMTQTGAFGIGGDWKVYDQLYSRYTDVVTLIPATSPQSFTANWADAGVENDMRGYTRLGVFLTLDINDTTDARIRALGKHTNAGTEEYVLPIKIVSAAQIAVTPEYIEFSTDADNLYILIIETQGVIPFIQLQIQAGTVGASAGQIDALYVTKAWGV